MKTPILLPLACAFAAACTATPPIPEALAPANADPMAMTLPARGVQIYECRATGNGDAQWAFVAPDAELLDMRGHVVASHGAGPSWEAPDGSRITATVKAKAAAPDARDIPWLLLEAKSNGHPGRFAHVTSVQRVNTHGGAAPQSGCSRETLGSEARVNYIAEYRFFSPRTER